MITGMIGKLNYSYIVAEFQVNFITSIEHMTHLRYHFLKGME